MKMSPPNGICGIQKLDLPVARHVAENKLSSLYRACACFQCVFFPRRLEKDHLTKSREESKTKTVLEQTQQSITTKHLGHFNENIELHVSFMTICFCEDGKYRTHTQHTLVCLLDAALRYFIEQNRFNRSVAKELQVSGS